DDGGEEVGGEDDGQVVAEPVDGGVIGGVEPDEEVGVRRGVEPPHEAEHGAQLRRRQLAGAAGAVGEAGETDLLVGLFRDGRGLEHGWDGSERRGRVSRVGSSGRDQLGQSATVKLPSPDAAVPPGPVAVARTVPEPWSGVKAELLSWADQRLPDPVADSVVVRSPTSTRNVTWSTLPVVPVEIVALVGWPHPHRL